MIHKPGDPLSPKAGCACELDFYGRISTLPLLPLGGPYRIVKRPIGFVYFDPPETVETDWGESRHAYVREWGNDVI
jgi:hypothetical protein